MTASFANSVVDLAGDDLSRNVFCLLGMPIDVEDMPSVLGKIRAAAARKLPFFITAPNLNTLVTMQSDPEFRKSLYESDLCPVDGMPIVWMARLLGIPIKSRIAGSDMFDALKSQGALAEPLKVFLFGGLEGVAASACQALNARPNGVRCVGSFYPGFGSVDDMSGDDVIAENQFQWRRFFGGVVGCSKRPAVATAQPAPFADTSARSFGSRDQFPGRHDQASPRFHARFRCRMDVAN